MEKVTHKQARKRYMRAFWPLMAVYVAVVLGGSYVLDQFDPEPVWLATIVALAASLPLVFVFLAMMRYFSEADEYTRLVQLKSFAWGGAITISVITVIGFLQLFHVIDHFDIFWFCPGFFFAYGIAYWMHGGKDCA